MAKQTMVLKVRMKCEECRTKAMTIVAGTHGVTAVRLERGKGKLMVEGERVDIADLVQTLAKKVGDTEILYVYKF
ncbi:hypothetical protein Bca4012_013570 [Brassica carinata]